MRLKESDRLLAVRDLVRTLGGTAHIEGDNLYINGTGSLTGGTVTSHNDHRLVMAATLMALYSDDPITITDSQAINKSYPLFFSHWNQLAVTPNNLLSNLSKQETLMSSSFGKNLTISVFGASHGKAIGAVVDGLPCGVTVDEAALARFMKRRAPGQSLITTQRKEADQPVFLSGLVEGQLSGSPLAFYIENTNQHSKDYNNLRDIPRPSHADYTARMRYGEKVDMRGGGHFSGRLTAPLCCAGGIALQILKQKGIEIGAHLKQIGSVQDTTMSFTEPDMAALQKVSHETVAWYPLRHALKQLPILMNCVRKGILPAAL